MENTLNKSNENKAITTQNKPPRKYVRKEKPVETAINGKIKTTHFRSCLRVFDAIVESKKLTDLEVEGVKYFVNFMIDEYNAENQELKR